MTADDLLESLQSRGARAEVLPTGGLVIEVDDNHELDDADVEAIREHKTMLVRWVLASIIEKEVGFEVEIAEWTGRVLPEPDWPGERPRSVYQVIPSSLESPVPDHEGFWALLYDHPPRLYRTPLRATEGFLRAWDRHLDRLRRRSEARSRLTSPASPPWPPRPAGADYRDRGPRDVRRGEWWLPWHQPCTSPAAGTAPGAPSADP
jgi:hypothetical protein